MELRQLSYFVTVVEEGSFSGAAAARHLSQPSLSVAVGQLEKALGVTLLRRHARGVDPTEAGRFVAQEARRILGEVRRLPAQARAREAGQAGRLVVATVAYASWDVLPQALAAFAKRTPEVAIDVLDLPPDGVIDTVRAGLANVGIVFCADTDALRRTAAAGMQAARLRRERLAVVVPRHSPAVGPEGVDLAMLGNVRWITPTVRSSFPGLGEVVAQAWRDAGIAPRDRRSTGTIATVLSLVSAGQGVALLPESAAKVAPPDVDVVPVDMEHIGLEVALVWEDALPSAVLAGFLSAVVGEQARPAG